MSQRSPNQQQLDTEDSSSRATGPKGSDSSPHAESSSDVSSASSQAGGGAQVILRISNS